MAAYDPIPEQFRILKPETLRLSLSRPISRFPKRSVSEPAAFGWGPGTLNPKPSTLEEGRRPWSSCPKEPRVPRRSSHRGHCPWRAQAPLRRQGCAAQDGRLWRGITVGKQNKSFQEDTRNSRHLVGTIKMVGRGGLHAFSKGPDTVSLGV